MCCLLEVATCTLVILSSANCFWRAVLMESLNHRSLAAGIFSGHINFEA